MYILAHWCVRSSRQMWSLSKQFIWSTCHEIVCARTLLQVAREQEFLFMLNTTNGRRGNTRLLARMQSARHFSWADDVRTACYWYKRFVFCSCSELYRFTNSWIINNIPSQHSHRNIEELCCAVISNGRHEYRSDQNTLVRIRFDNVTRFTCLLHTFCV